MKYIASYSGGKDSTAQIIIAHEKKIPIDLIIFSEVMFDDEISGELPEHIDFIKNKAFPMFEEWGYKTKILHSNITYMDYFNATLKRSKVPERIGKKHGFPMSGRCGINRDCKVKPIREFLKSLEGEEVTQYIGIAADEPKRLERMKNNCISLLDKYGCTEEKALDLCKKYNLLSPIYDFAPRGGCWFCPNMRNAEVKHLRNQHPDLWNRLLKLEEEQNTVGYIWDTREKRSIHEIERELKNNEQ